MKEASSDDVDARLWMSTTEGLRRYIEHGTEKHLASAAKERLFIEFNAIDQTAVVRKSDIDLAGWQAQYPRESPQFIFAEQLWKYRLARKVALLSACIALFSASFAAVSAYVMRSAESASQQRSDAPRKENAEPPVASKKTDPPQGVANGRAGQAQTR